MEKDIRGLIKKLTNHITLEHCVIRFIMAWCFVSVLQTVNAYMGGYHQIDQINFIRNFHFGTTIMLILWMFLLIYVLFELGTVKSKRISNYVEKLSLLFISIIYAVLQVVMDTDIYFCIGMTALLAFAVCYCVKDRSALPANISRTALIVGMIVLGVLFVVFTGGCTIVRYLSYSSPNYDLGLFSQMFHYMKTTLTMNSTSERDMLLSHFAVHISPAFYQILPFYALFSSPATLQLMQAVVIALGLIPLAGICKNHQMSRFETLLMGIVYVCYPVMSGGCFYDIHENLFLPVFLLTFLYFIEKDSWRGILISMALVFSVKEDASIYVAFIAIYMILGLKMYKKGLVVLSCALAYFSFTTILLSILGDGVMSFRFNNMILEDNGNMLSIIKTVIMHPTYVMTQIMQEDKIEFILQTLGPLLFMPLFSKKWYRFILVCPYILFNLMSDYTYFHSIYFQYVFGSGTILIYLVILNVTDMSAKVKMRMIPMLAAAAVLFFVSIMWVRIDAVKDYQKSYNQETYQILEEGINQIPKDASVIATTFLCPALSDRDELYELYYTDQKAEYVALDLRVGTTEYNVHTYLDNPEYETIYYVPMKIGVFRVKSWNEE